MNPNKLKFRLWDGEKMDFYGERIALTLDGKIVNAADGDFVLSADDLIIMQSTGLIDKNGKEIFEGDIIKMNEGQCSPGEEGIDIVIFEKGMFRTKYDWNDGHYCKGAGYYLDGECSIEVIGNKFENIELISK